MFKELDPLLHSQLRLAIMSLLMSVESAEFTFIREQTQSTAGNLSVQLDKLTEAGYILIEKTFRGKKPLTTCREGSTARARAEGFDIAASREAFFETADVISLHLPSNNETRGIVTAGDLARMKPDALLVNTSRAPIIAEGALVTALKQGRPGFAAVDVYETEPVVGADHPLLQMPNVLCAPHLGYAERLGYEALYNLAVDQLLAFAEGQPINVANPEAVGKR
jgi:D-3-phosphoglycerate dehydrogenase